MTDVQLIHGDCLEVMPTIADNSVDLTVTSPPYDNLRTYNGTLDWGEHVWKPVLEQLYRVTKDGGVVVWIVNDATIKGSETGTSFRQALYAMECGFRLYDTMIWDKEGCAALGNIHGYASVFEYMFILSKGKPEKQNTIKDRRNIRAGEIQHSSRRRKDGSLGKTTGYGIKPISEYGRRHNVWRIPPCKSKAERLHPAPFPEALIEDHIKSWSNEGDTVFDPFMGSATTGKMALLNGRNFIGIEKDQGYFDIALKRIAEAGERLAA